MGTPTDAWNRTLPTVGLLLFLVSTAFPIGAGVGLASPPSRWVGVADVGIAAALIGIGVVLAARAPRQLAMPVLAASLGVCQGLATLALLLLGLFFLVGDRIRWDVLVPGLVWRVGFLVLVLPAWIASWKPELQDEWTARRR